MAAGLLDTSVVIDLLDPSIAGKLPDEMAIFVITVAELTAGSLLAGTAVEAAKRQSRLQEESQLGGFAIADEVLHFIRSELSSPSARR